MFISRFVHVLLLVEPFSGSADQLGVLRKQSTDCLAPSDTTSDAVPTRHTSSRNKR